MMKKNLFINVAFLLIAILFNAISQCSSALSNKRLCYDHECSEPVSLARTSIRYNPNEPGILPFDVNVKVKVYSKEAGNRTDLWGVEINGKRGYAPKKFLKEYKILHKNLTYEVPTNRLPHNNNASDTELQPKKDNDKAEFVAKDTKASNTQTNNLNLKSTEELPVVSDVTPPYEIIDGTTFHLGHNEPTVQPASVTEVVQTTAVPNKQDAVHNAGLSSSSVKVKSNIFTAENKLQKEISSDKVKSNEQRFPETVDIKDFVTSSEEMLHVPEIAGIQVPALDVNGSLKTNDLSKVEHAAQSAKNDTTIEMKEAQSLEEPSNITVSEISTPHDAEEALNKNVSHSNVNDTSALELEKNHNTDTIKAVTADDAKTDTKAVQDITKSETKDAETLNNLTQLKTEEISTSHGTEEAPNKNVTHSNVNDKSAIELKKKRNTDKIKAVAADDAETDTKAVQNTTKSETKDAETLYSVTQLKTEEISTPLTKNVSHSNANDQSALELEKKHNTDRIKPVAGDGTETDTKTVQSITKSEINNAETLQNVSELKAEEIFISHDTKEALNKNVSHSNVNDKSAIGLEKKRNTDKIKAVAANDAITDTKAVQNTTTSGTKGAETLNSVTQLKTEEISTPLNKNVSHSNVNDKSALELEKKHNTDRIKPVAGDGTETDTKTVQSIVKSEINNAETLQNVTELKTEEIYTSHDTEEALNKNVTYSNVNDTSAIELEKKQNTDTIKAVASDDAKTDTKAAQSIIKSEAKDAETLKNLTQLGTEEIKSKQDSKGSGNTLITSSNTDTHVSPLSIKSYVLDAVKLTLSSNSDEKITGEQVHSNSSLEISSGERNVPIPSKSAEVKVTPSTTTVSPTPQNANQNLEENNNATFVSEGDSNEELQKDTVQDKRYESEHDTEKEISEIVNTTIADNILENETNVHINVSDDSHSIEVPRVVNELHAPTIEESNLSTPELLYSDETSMISENIESINEFHNRNLLNADIGEQLEIENLVNHETDPLKNEALTEHEGDISVQDKVLHEDSNTEDIVFEAASKDLLHQVQVPPPHVCAVDNVECSFEDNSQSYFSDNEGTSQNSENALMEGIKIESNYWLTLMYVSITATTTLIFSLGYYYIENMRRDGKLIARINKLEKDLLISTKECTMLNDNLKLTKDKLTSIEDESFGSNEMVLSLKADLEASQNAKAELEKQVDLLEKDLESATEAGLELERMLREVLSSNDDVNPLAQSVEDLQRRLNAQQAANESLTNVLNLKTQENESLSAELVSLKKKCEELEVELTRVAENLKAEENSKNSIEKTLTDKVHQLEMQIKEISTEKIALLKEIKGKEVEIKDLVDVINRLNCNNLDLDKLYDVSRIKAEATALLEEGNELKIRLTDVEGAHNLLEEHMKLVKEEVVTLSEQCRVAEKEKKDAETRLEVLSSFFQEKEAQRQKEEAVWLQQQGEVLSTVERIQTMQNEIQNYKQQIEMLKREILDQEREYKNQMSVLETKAHEQWVIARQVERRLEESKVEAGQLRNRLTLIEKNINDADSEAKLHRLEANGETATSPPLFIGPESSSSPVMFSGSTNVPPPPPPSYLHSLFPPYLPPPLPNAPGVPSYEVSQRPPPLGGRLSSPPPMPLHPPASSRYDNAGSPPPPMSPHLLPHFDHRSPPHLFASDHIHPPPPPPGSILPPPLGTTHSWGEESLPPPRNSGFHPPRRERVRNHKGSLHSSGDSLDKTHHNSKV